MFISISDKLLFKSGSSVVSNAAMSVLANVAKVLNANPQLVILVEGHTDSVPIKNNCIVDNWDLSVHRANSIVRILVDDFGVDPARMTAAGRSEYIPIASNSTSEGKARNRRTRIVILPELGQFYGMIEEGMKQAEQASENMLNEDIRTNITNPNAGDQPEDGK